MTDPFNPDMERPRDWEDQPLWKPVDNPCGKPGVLARPRSTPFQEINLLYLHEVVDALCDAFDTLAAHLDQLRNRIDDIAAPPIPPDELKERTAQLREGL